MRKGIIITIIQYRTRSFYFHDPLTALRFAHCM